MDPDPTPLRRQLGDVDTWVFDLDNTLYHPSTCDLFPHMDRRMNEFICDLLKIAPAEANRLRQTFFTSYGTTLRGLMDRYSVEPGRFLDYVHDLDLSIVALNPALDAALHRLPGRKVIFTNATERHALRVLERLGIHAHFEEIFDVAAAEFLPKPNPAAYDAFVRRYGIAPRRAAMFEDTARNLEPARALGMRTIWVRNDRPHAQPPADTDYIDHIVDDLAGWLDGLAPASPVTPPAA